MCEDGRGEERGVYGGLTAPATGPRQNTCVQYQHRVSATSALLGVGVRQTEAGRQISRVDGL